jgi:hypothetical protein
MLEAATHSDSSLDSSNRHPILLIGFRLIDQSALGDTKNFRHNSKCKCEIFIPEIRFPGRIVGPVEDEFDNESHEIEPAGPGQFIIPGGTSLTIINRQLKLQLVSAEAKTLSGLLMEKADRIANVGDRFEQKGAEAEVMEMRGSRAFRARLALIPGPIPE